MPLTEHSTGIALERKPRNRSGVFSSQRERTLVLSLALVAVTLVAYAPLKENGFVNYDDDRYITANSHVQAGLSWSNVAWAFRTNDVSNWHPLTWISHMADVQLFGMNPAGHHLTNLFFHIANVWLLFVVLYLGTGSLWRSFVVAMIFAVHPLNVQSVAWAAERKNVLSTLFWLLAILAYGWYARSPNWKRYLAVLLGFALGLMAKPMVITLPLVLLLLDYWPLRRIARHNPPDNSAVSGAPAPSSWWLVAEKIPFLILSLGSAAVTIVAQRSGGSFVAGTMLPIWSRPKNALVAYPLYIFKLFWPAHLSIYYPHPAEGFSWWQASAALLLLLAATFAALALKRRRYVLVGWLYFVVTLTPVIGIIQIGDQVAADRYMYLPMMGLLVILTWGAADALARIRPGPLALVVVMTVLALTWITRQQLTYWRDSISLFSHALEVTHDNLIAHINLGHALDEAGQPAAAILQYQAALAIQPSDPMSQYDLATHLQQQGKKQEAIQHYEDVLSLTHNAGLQANAHNNLAMLLDEQGDQNAAEAHYRQAIRLAPQEVKAYLNLGLMLEKHGDLEPATAVFAQSVAAAPTPAGYFFLGRALQRQHRVAEAVAAYQQALRIAPDFEEARQQLEALQHSSGAAHN